MSGKVTKSVAGNFPSINHSISLSTSGIGSSNTPNPEIMKAIDELDRYMKQMESDNGPIGSKDVAELQLHYAKKMRQVSLV